MSQPRACQWARTRRLAAVIAVVLLFMSSTSAAQGDLEPGLVLPAGSFVEAGDPELPNGFKSIASDTSICFSATEPPAVYWVLTASCEGHGAGSLRLAPAASYAAGTQVAASDADADALLEAPGGLRLSFLDVDESATFTYGDTAYLAYCVGINCTIGSEVQSGWLRLSAHDERPAGTWVESAEGDHGSETLQVGTPFTAPLERRGAHLWYWDLDGDGDHEEEPLYWRASGRSNSPAPGWLRLTDAPGGSAFSILAPGAREVAPGKLTSIAAVSVCYLDLDEDGDISNEDPIYLVAAAACPATPPDHALRLTGTENHPPGSYVTFYDWDRFRDLSAANATTIRYADLDGSGDFTNGDAVYLLFCESTDCEEDWRIRHGAIRLSATEHAAAGTRVFGADPDFFARAEKDAPGFETPYGSGRFAFWSATGAKSLQIGAVLYWRADALTDKTPALGMLRVSPFPDGTGMGGLLDASAPESTTALHDTTPKGKTLCYADASSTGGYQAGDPVYVVAGACADAVQPGAIRLVATMGEDGGTIVAPGDPDEERVLHNATEFAGFRSIKAGAPGARPDTEAIYVCLDDDGCAEGGTRPVKAGWLRLSPSAHGDAMTPVLDGDGDVDAETGDPAFITKATDRKNLTAVLEHHWVYWDLDASGTLSQNDLVYLQMKGNAARPAAGDLRITSASMDMPAEWFPNLIDVRIDADGTTPDPTRSDDPREGRDIVPDGAQDSDEEEVVPGILPLLPFAVAALLGALRRGRAPPARALRPARSNR